MWKASALGEELQQSVLCWQRENIAGVYLAPSVLCRQKLLAGLEITEVEALLVEQLLALLLTSCLNLGLVSVNDSRVLSGRAGGEMG